METIATDFKPFGMLGGMYAGQNAANAQAMNNQAMEKTALEQLVKQRDAAFAQDEMNNPEVRAMRLQGMIGKDQSAVAAGALAKATNESDIKAKIAENVAKIPKAELEAQMAQHTGEFNALRMLDMAGESSGYQGLDFDQKLMQIGQKVGMPQQELQKFMQSPPQQRGAMLKSRLGKLEQILTLTPKVLQEMAKQNNQADNTEFTAEGNRQSAEDIAAANNASRSADRAAAREDRAANKESSEAMRKEAELTRRMDTQKNLLKAYQDQEEAAQKKISEIPLHLNKTDRAARAIKIEREILDIREKQIGTVTEMERLGTLSSFAPKAEGTTVPKSVIPVSSAKPTLKYNPVTGKVE